MSDFTTIPLSKQGKTKGLYETIVSPEDADLALFRWTTQTSGNRDKVYAAKTFPPSYKKVLMHRIIMERIIGRPLEKHELVDHRNMNGLDNQRDNLRLATNRQNLANAPTRKNNTSGYKGVVWLKRDRKWRAEIRIDGKQTHLGVFDNIEDAYKAYCDKAIEIYGEFARLEQLLKEGIVCTMIIKEYVDERGVKRRVKVLRSSDSANEGIPIDVYNDLSELLSNSSENFKTKFFSLLWEVGLIEPKDFLHKTAHERSRQCLSMAMKRDASDIIQYITSLHTETIQNGTSHQ